MSKRTIEEFSEEEIQNLVLAYMTSQGEEEPKSFSEQEIQIFLDAYGEALMEAELIISMVAAGHMLLSWDSENGFRYALSDKGREYAKERLSQWPTNLS